jgi:hypothetical protein
MAAAAEGDGPSLVADDAGVSALMALIGRPQHPVATWLLNMTLGLSLYTPFLYAALPTFMHSSISWTVGTLLVDPLIPTDYMQGSATAAHSLCGLLLEVAANQG